MELGALVPGAPPSLAHVPLEVGMVGGALWAAVLVDSSPRPPAFASSLAAELQTFLARAPDIEEVRLVHQVVGAMRMAGPDPGRPLLERLLALEPQREPAQLAA
jgi:hypothetical protein